MHLVSQTFGGLVPAVDTVSDSIDRWRADPPIEWTVVLGTNEVFGECVARRSDGVHAVVVVVRHRDDTVEELFGRRVQCTDGVWSLPRAQLPVLAPELRSAELALRVDEVAKHACDNVKCHAIDRRFPGLADSRELEVDMRDFPAATADRS